MGVVDGMVGVGVVDGMVVVVMGVAGIVGAGVMAGIAAMVFSSVVVVVLEKGLVVDDFNNL